MPSEINKTKKDIASNAKQSNTAYERYKKHMNTKAYAEKMALDETDIVPDSKEPLGIKKRKAKYPKETMFEFVQRRKKERAA